MTLYFLGGGNMASAIIAGLQRQSFSHTIHVANRGAAKREALAAQFGISVSEKLPELHADDVLILAVKPQDMQTACADIQTNGALIISLAAGISIATLSRYLGGNTRIIRAMPNTPAQIGLGIAGLFAPAHLSDADKTIAHTIFAASCHTIWLDNEAQIHAITAISGSGSGYVFYLMNALQQAAQNFGFAPQQARELSIQTFKGAVALAEQTGEDLVTLQNKVTSKGGTTAAALDVFRLHQIAEHLCDGTQAAAKRSQELANLFETQ
ncbi:pyrroline-5-carboxylate reductase [Wielerella bovis]|uniref:pyrroline-5-carboxylate reductase n=1 Tax=Wielerella bovis TaxID=2917790 RepID=UPI002018BCE1|nr:pyrroline-5-carboxylate reductase [Wielerella bovis]ULJ64299.1 pyrroline-5-carboxylate reductase [Wielerella bovis]ULJ66518.1 pyrroline-5-carboxylate reductase [Wielerella bovis]